MAIDTADKRASCFGCSIASLTIYPEPDGTIDGADRRHAMALYRGPLDGDDDVAGGAGSTLYRLLMGIG